MSIVISSKLSRDQKKKWYYFEWGKEAGQRMASGIYTYTRPKDLIQRNFNKEAISLLETKQSQMTLDRQATSSGYIPLHKLKSNFLDFYGGYVNDNKMAANRHLECSFNTFKKFLGDKKYISPIDITEELCEKYRNFLLKNFNGETPSNYFMRFKKVMKSAKRAGYFRDNPSEDISSKTNPNKQKKEILTKDDYLKLLDTPCNNYEVKKAFIFSIYSGLRWADIKVLTWDNIKPGKISLFQKKTKVELDVPMHPIIEEMIGERKSGLIFYLPTSNGANKVLKGWCETAGVDKHITWHCARHSFSVLLQNNGIDTATVAGMLGHTTSKYVHSTYQRYQQLNATEAIKRLPENRC